MGGDSIRLIVEHLAGDGRVSRLQCWGPGGVGFVKWAAAALEEGRRLSSGVWQQLGSLAVQVEKKVLRV